MGNVLHGDDGFGVAVAEALSARKLSPNVKIMDVGIGGIHLVQELLQGYDALVIVDAVDQGAPPGTVFVLTPEVPDLASMASEERMPFLADMHYTVPSRALIMAKALGALPEQVWIVGCQPGTTEELGLELSPAVRRAVPEAAARIEHIVTGLEEEAGDPPR